MVNALIEAGVDRFATDAQGRTALWHALQNARSFARRHQKSGVWAGGEMLHTAALVRDGGLVGDPDCRHLTRLLAKLMDTGFGGFSLSSLAIRRMAPELEAAQSQLRRRKLERVARRPKAIEQASAAKTKGPAL
jgi:hypothetical protein